MVAPLLFGRRDLKAGTSTRTFPNISNAEDECGKSNGNDKSRARSEGSAHPKRINSYYGAKNQRNERPETVAPVELYREITAMTDMLREVVTSIHQERRENKSNSTRRSETGLSKHFHGLSLSRYVSGIRRRSGKSTHIDNEVGHRQLSEINTRFRINSSQKISGTYDYE